MVSLRLKCCYILKRGFSQPLEVLGVNFTKLRKIDFFQFIVIKLKFKDIQQARIPISLSKVLVSTNNFQNTYFRAVKITKFLNKLVPVPGLTFIYFHKRACLLNFYFDLYCTCILVIKVQYIYCQTSLYIHNFICIKLRNKLNEMKFFQRNCLI